VQIRGKKTILEPIKELKMKISVNGKETILTDNPERSVDSLLEELDVSQRLYVTVELNGEILDREAYPATPVNESDVIEFLYFMGGGAR
jgi:sulfur carrier protein